MAPLVRAGLLLAALWVWTGDHRDYRDPMLTFFVMAARVGLVLVALALIALLSL